MSSKKLVINLFAIMLLLGNALAQGQRPATVNLPGSRTSAWEFSDPKAAADYLITLSQQQQLWKPEADTLRLSLLRLAEHFKEPTDSVILRLEQMRFSAGEIQQKYISIHDTLPLRWIGRNLFIVDTVKLDVEPYITQKTVYLKAIDQNLQTFRERPQELQLLLDSLMQVRDTILETVVDYAYLKSRGIQPYQMVNGRTEPSVLPPGSRKTYRILSDSSALVITDTRRVLAAGDDSPFMFLPGVQTPDSLQKAVNSLIAHVQERDSLLLYFADFAGRQTPFWLSSGKSDMVRYWVRNQANDSVTIWMGNPGRRQLSMMLEEDVQLERKRIDQVADVPIARLEPQRTLVRITPLTEIPVYWDYGFTSAFSLNQTYLSNWARGGESSFASMLDLNASARYTHKQRKVQWTNTGRLRYGTLRTKQNGSRTSADIIELNSKYNRTMREKLDFSSVFYMKTQSAKGYRYPNDSVPVSKFLNPGSFTLGVGVEYEPVKKHLLNFSVLSYRNTFVLDTANINQRTHGIDPDKRSRQEMGGQLVIKNSFTLFNALDVNNSVRLFSNYLDNPQNVDVDWELKLEHQLSWFFTIRFNLHLIYDDDIRFAVLDAQGEPVLNPDGSPKRVPKTQLNQFVGLTLSFKI